MNYIPMKVEIFTDANNDVTGLPYMQRLMASNNIHYYKLDKINKIEKELSAGLPAQEHKAKIVIDRRMAKIDKVAFQKAVSNAFQGVIYAFRYKLTHYPAIVINNGEAIIYGVYDVKQAMRIYRDWKRS